LEFQFTQYDKNICVDVSAFWISRISFMNFRGFAILALLFKEDGPVLRKENRQIVGCTVSGDGFRIVDDDTPTWEVPQLPFYDHVPVNARRPEAPERMTVADKHMLAVDSYQAVQGAYRRTWRVQTRGSGTEAVSGMYSCIPRVVWYWIWQ
jgi:hypothetical protein